MTRRECDEKNSVGRQPQQRKNHFVQLSHRSYGARGQLARRHRGQEGGRLQKCAEALQIVDLPGIYSLSPYTPEEVISRNFILDEKPDCIINIVDATNLERNLYLTTQLMEIDVPIVVALNMMDAVRKTAIRWTELHSKRKSVCPWWKFPL